MHYKEKETAVAEETIEQLSGPIKTEGLVVFDLHDWVMQIGKEFVPLNRCLNESEDCKELNGSRNCVKLEQRLDFTYW